MSTSLTSPVPEGPLQKLFTDTPASPVAGVLQKVLAIDRFNALYRAIRQTDDGRPFPLRLLQALHVEPRVSRQDLERIPKDGAVLAVANHPFGLIEAVVLATVLPAVRPDVKFLTNAILSRFPELRDLCIFVDPFGGPAARQNNRQGLRLTMEWLEKQQGLLAVFPAGEVAHVDFRRRAVIDPEWNENIARIARRTGATVLPLYFSGANSKLFQVLGMVHPRLRTAMLPHEFLNKHHQRIDLRIGNPIGPKRMSAFASDAEAIEYLRQRTYLLEHRRDVKAEDRPRFHLSPQQIFQPSTTVEPVIPPVAEAVLEREIAALPPSQLLAEAGSTQTWIASAGQIPGVLREIGRLREVTFREAGEGTGKPVDLDEFDVHYQHLFLWEARARRIVGAYRLGITGEIVARHGLKGLYTSTLFHYGSGFLDKLGPCLEMGRSFVRSEEQRGFAPLLLLWKGIAAWVSRNPEYKTLFGPVSISNDYKPVSRELMVRFLEGSKSAGDLTGLVKARTPFRGTAAGRFDRVGAALEWDLGELSTLVSEVETDQKGVPVLLKQYLKMGGRLVCFNVDAKFSNALDGLIVVDLTASEPQLLERYMGRAEAANFLDFHRRRRRSA